MRYLITCLLLITLHAFLYAQPYTNEASKKTFDFDWKFCLGDQPGAEVRDYDDAKWRLLNVPHDFSIEQPFSQNNITGKEGGYTFSGIGWYRKHFLSNLLVGQRAIIRFNGIYRNSEVWVNGHYLGLRPYGYSTFEYDITPYLNTNSKENVLAVKVNTAEQPNSRWYTGSGIYRHVWFLTTGSAWFQTGGVFATVKEINAENAVVNINWSVCNVRPGKYTLINDLLDASGSVVANFQQEVQLKANDTLKGDLMLKITQPKLWSLENPYLYTLKSSIVKNRVIEDNFSCKVGIRSFRFDPDKGFFLNDKHVKLKGVNNHHDGGPLGSACMDHTFERQVRLLKSMGCNALRMSHNPPAPELLNCADSLGMLVIDEIFDEWTYGKKKFGYSPYYKDWHQRDVEDWVRRDRNHPSIIAWSVGNEIPEQTNAKNLPVLKDLIRLVKQQDSTRPVTMAVNEIPKANKSGFTGLLDIVGYNYQEPNYFKDHQTYPNRIIFGTETTIFPYHTGVRFPLHTYQEWLVGQQQDFVAGEFLWTGFDYIGESGIGAGGYNYEPWNYWPSWPWRSAICGVIDLCGFDKPGYWFRKALWSNEPVLYMAVQTDTIAQYPDSCSFWGWSKVAPHWNGLLKGQKLAIHVYTNCKTVELFLNNRSLGKKDWNLSQRAFLFWNEPFEPGELRAEGVSMDGSRHSFSLKTASVPYRMVLSPDRLKVKSDGHDISYVKVQLLDMNGIEVPFASDTISFDVQGAGHLLAVGNGSPMSHTSFKGNKIEAWQGKCLAVIQAGRQTGKIKLIAKSKGLKDEFVEIEAEK